MATTAACVMPLWILPLDNAMADSTLRIQDRAALSQQWSQTRRLLFPRRSWLMRRVWR